MIPSVRLADHVGPVDTWNPATDCPNQKFNYVDISAIDREDKVISSVSSVTGSDAPSRARQILRIGDVVVSTVRPNLNAVAIVPEALDGATASTGFCVLRPRAGLHPRYLYRWVRSPWFVSNMARLATGASYPAVSDWIVKASRFPLPPLVEQRRIAAILDQADTLRSKRRATIAKLEALVAAIFENLFGDPLLNPRAWPVRSLEQVCQKITDGEHLNPQFTEAGMPMVMAGNVLDDQVDIDSSKKVSIEAGEGYRRKCDPERGDILLVSRGATIGRLCEVSNESKFCLMGSVILLKPNRSMVFPVYLRSLLKHPWNRRRLNLTSGSSAQQAIYLKDLKQLPCPVPDFQTQQTFAEKMARVSHLARIGKLSLAKMEPLFASLQHRAFRGEL
jgi:type I restriction enzyme S subunit